MPTGYSPSFGFTPGRGMEQTGFGARAQVLYVHPPGLKCSPATQHCDPSRKLNTVQCKEHLGQRLSCGSDRRISQEKDAQKVSLATVRKVKSDNSLPARDLQTNKNSFIMWCRCRLCSSGRGFAPAPKQSCTRSGSSSSLRFKLDASCGRRAQNSHAALSQRTCQEGQLYLCNHSVDK